MFKKKYFKAAVFSAMALTASWSMAATGEMGTGTPQFGVYTAPIGSNVRIWLLAGATIPMPSSCTHLLLYSATVGMDHYKIAIALMTTAKVSGKKIRFYAHAERDGGCGVDYVELVD
jgi:hypothetical protein